MIRQFVPTFENGKLVKLDGMRPEYMGGYDLIRAAKQFAARVAELETLLARNLFFDAGSAEEALDALGGWDRATELVDLYREANAQPERDHGVVSGPQDLLNKQIDF